MKPNKALLRTTLLLALALVSIGQVAALNVNTYWDNNQDTTQIDPGQQATYYIDAIPNSWANTLDVEVTLYDDTGSLLEKGIVYEETGIDADSFYYSPELHITEQDYEYSGDYFLDIKVTQHNNDGTQTVRSNQLYLDVTGERLLNADFTFEPQNPTDEDTVTFTSTSDAEGATLEQKKWSVNGQQFATGQQAQKQFDEGTYDVTLTITDSIDRTDSETKTVTVQKAEQDEGPTADFEFKPENPEVDEEVTFTSTSSEGSSEIRNYQWSVNGQLMRVGNPATLTFDEPGTYDVELRVIDENGLEDTTAKDVHVQDTTQELRLEELGVNKNVVQTKKQHFTGKVVDQEHEPVENAHITFRVEHPETEYGTCTTNFKGHCNINPTIDLEPGFYDVTAIATKQGYEPDNTRNLQQTFQVWEQRYTIKNLETYEDKFETINDTFYRANPVYVGFDIEDDFTGEKIEPPTDLITDVKLKVNNIEGGGFDPIDILSDGEDLEKVGDEGNFRYKLPEIPITDNFLGDGKVFAFAFNFTDDTAGQGSKNVTILNNPVQFDKPDDLELREGDTEKVDFKQYLDDVETPTDLIELTFNTDTIQIEDQGQNVFSFTAPQQSEGTYNVDVEADDTDGSTKQQSFTITVLPEHAETGPTADFEFSPENPEVDEDVTFTSTSNRGSSAIVSTEWTIDGESFTGEEVTTTFNSEGTYNVELRVTDENDLQDTTTKIVTVQEKVLPPQADFEFTPENPRVNEEVTFTSTSTDPQGQDLDKAWDVTGDGTVDKRGDEVTFEYSQAGTYTVHLNVQNEDGLQDSVRKDITVEPNQKPEADFEFSPENPEVDEDVTFTSTSTDLDGHITDWAWEVDGQKVSDQEEFTQTFDRARDYTVRLRVTDNDGAQDAVTKTVTVNAQTEAPTADFEFSPENPEVDEDVTFTSTSSEGSSEITAYEWTVNGQQETGETFTTSFSTEGTYSVELRVTDENNLESSATGTVEILPALQSPTISVEGPQETKTDTATTFNATFSDPDGTVEHIEWNINGETVQQKQNPDSPNTLTQLFDEAGTYNVSATVTDNDGLTATDSLTVTVEQLATPTANLDIQPNRKEGQTVLLDGSDSTTPQGEIETYEWEITQPDGSTLLTNTTTASSINPVFPERGVHTVTLTVTNTEGLQDTVTKQTTIFKQGTHLEPLERDVSLGGWSVKGPEGLGEITLGEPFTVQTSISNMGTEQAENLRLSFKLPEFGYTRTGQEFSTGSKEGQGRRLSAVMYDIPPGTYPAIVELNGDNVHRKKTLEVQIHE